MKIRKKTAAGCVAGPESKAIEPLIQNKSIGYEESRAINHYSNPKVTHS